MSHRCIITDDEPIALEILEDYVRMVPGLVLAASCKDAMETMAVLQRQKIDLLFLDIQMPGISGLQLLKSMTGRPAVILTTAYPGYAVEGFDLDVVDYLLKPIAVERFLRAMGRFWTRYGKAAAAEAGERGVAAGEGRGTAGGRREIADGSGVDAGDGILYIRSRGEWVKLVVAQILYIEGLENYVRIYMKDKVLISLSTMKSIEESLLSGAFLRIHRSYIVNLAELEGIGSRQVRIGEKVIPVGKSYQARVMQRLKDHLI